MIEPTDKELYRVSFSTMFFCALNWGTLLTMGVLFKCISGCLIFMVSYIPLRIFSGGLHLSTKTRCYCFSIVIFSAMIALYRFELYLNIVYYILIIASFPLIALLAPGEDKNKPLLSTERTRNKRIVVGILLIEAIVLVALHQNGADNIIFFPSFSLVLMLFQLILGEIRNSRMLLT